MNQIRALLQRTFGLVKHHVGTDQFGNKYYYIPQQKTWTGLELCPPSLLREWRPRIPERLGLTGMLLLDLASLSQSREDNCVGVSLEQYHWEKTTFQMASYLSPSTEYLTWEFGQSIRSKRMIEAVNPKEIEYEVGNIPSEWEGIIFSCHTYDTFLPCALEIMDRHWGVRRKFCTMKNIEK
ncbi:NADH dehydrogenase [ubiquinone] 1 alpha subcomplex assembly factor 2 isoform X2 [Heterodontus francisci]|uniref:NADH dehydrogenase [ubiquinone] 1 alpha subcomplex assembly factor 2 isoform X2 n=1 Tax=Heterodontus francisci TaxID=7792 RepID=UPI00355BAD2F